VTAATGNLSVEAQARYAFVRSLLAQDFPPPASVVELGSAPGDQIADLARAGYAATSVDIGVAADAWGGGEEGRMRALLREAGVEDVTWNLEELPYPLPSTTYDAVIMTEVYEHLRDYPVHSLHEVARVLRPGGRLYFTTPNSAYIVNRVRAARGHSTASSLADWIGGLPHARHAREYTFGEVHQLMGYVGLEVVLSTSRHFHLESGRTGRAQKVVKQALARLAVARPTLGPSIVVVAEKPQP